MREGKRRAAAYFILSVTCCTAAASRSDSKIKRLRRTEGERRREILCLTKNRLPVEAKVALRLQIKGGGSILPDDAHFRFEFDPEFFINAPFDLVDEREIVFGGRPAFVDDKTGVFRRHLGSADAQAF